MEYSNYKTGQNPAKSLQAEIIFGAPGLDCLGSGICKIIPTNVNTDQWKCSHTSGFISVTPEGKLRLQFEKALLTNRQKDQYFRSSKFLVQKSYLLLRYFTKMLNVDKEIWIHPGEYNLLETSTMMMIEF